MRNISKAVLVAGGLALGTLGSAAAFSGAAHAQDVRFGISIGTPRPYYNPYQHYNYEPTTPYYGPRYNNPYPRPAYRPYSRPNCHWDAYYGQVCY